MNFAPLAPQIRGEQELKVPHSRIPLYPKRRALVLVALRINALRRYAKRYPLGRGVARLGGFRGRVRKTYYVFLVRGSSRRLTGEDWIIDVFV